MAIYTFVGYISIHISPSAFWIAGFFTLSLQVALALHLGFVLYWLLRKQYFTVFISLITLVAGYPLLQRSVAISGFEPTPAEVKTFQVMSYNVRTFNNHYFYNQKKTQPPQADSIIKL
ncbi:MAG: hypothetical protein HC817_03370 [Saprospiraceae bacterium]|nr:hypothetical protein [Saprospiraceae bacterium]